MCWSWFKEEDGVDNIIAAYYTDKLFQQKLCYDCCSGFGGVGCDESF
jgi:hypothetical protein